MKKFVAAIAVLAASLLGLSILAPAAQAYPEDTMVLSVNPTTVVSGKSINVTVNSDTMCNYVLTFAGDTKSGSGTSFSTTFTAPSVNKTTIFDVVATCTYAAGASQGTAAVRTADVSRTVAVTVKPAGQAGGNATEGTLPATGGPNGWFVGGGLALLVLGVGAVLASRRRVTGH